MRTSILKVITLAWQMLLIVNLGRTLISAEPGDLSKDDVSQVELAEFAIQMQKEVEALRGLEYKHPVNVGLYTEDQVRAFIERPLDAEEGWPETSRAEAAMEMIGLIPRNSGLLSTTQEMFINMSPPGLYNAETGELRVVKKPGMHLDSLSFQTIFIHELTHALDDQCFDFEKMGATAPSTSDAEIAVGSILEGSAVTLQQRYLGKVMSSRRIDFSQAQESMSNIMGDMQSVFNAPLYIVTMFFARFSSGASFLQFGERTLDSGSETTSGSGNTERTSAAPPFGLKCIAKAMQEAATNPPRSSEQILHPEKYWQPETRDEPIVVRDQDVEKLLAFEGLEVVHENTFGEIGCAVLTFPEDKRFSPTPGTPVRPSTWTNKSACGWGGDRFFLLSSETTDNDNDRQPAGLCGIWFTMWDTQDDCEEFIDNYEKHRPSIERRMLRLGSHCAVFLFEFNDSQQDKVTRRLQESPPNFRQDGRFWILSSASE